MYQLGQVGERFRIIAQKGRRAQCPAGTSQESSGRLGTGQEYAWCYRAPVFAPPPVTTTTISPQIITKVPTTVTTAVSPQISPTMAQQQASPGAAVTAAPRQVAPLQTGITEQQLRDIMSAQAAATEAERAADERRRQVEIETMRREIAERERATQEIDQARRADEARRIEADRFAREQAEADAIAAAAAIPPPPSMTYMPTGGGALPAMPAAPLLPPPDMAMEMEARDVTITQDGEIPWALIAIAAAGIGAVILVGGKGRKRKRGKK